MVDNIENTDIERQSNIDSYKDLLKSYILGKNVPSNLSRSELDGYMDMFSLYLKHSNEAYKYNLPYLGHKHKEYASFLISASEKTEKLRSILLDINNSDTIKKIIKDSSADRKNIKVSLNDFLTATLPDDIDFHKSFSFSGANRKAENDIITIEYNQQVRAVKLKGEYISKITATIEEILSNSVKNGGENNGPVGKKTSE